MLFDPKEQLKLLFNQISTTQGQTSSSVRVAGRNELVQTHSEDFLKIIKQSSELAVIHVRCKTVAEFFDQKTLDLQVKIRQTLLNFLLKPSTAFKLNHYRKVEELLWKRSYHDLYRFHKSNRHLLKKQDEQIFLTHFRSGMGYYSNLILQLRIRFSLGNDLILPEPLNFSLSAIDDFCISSKQNEEDCDFLGGHLSNNDDRLQKDWAFHAIYRSLIYMGDLARYLIEFDTVHDNRKLAYHYYVSSCKYCPENGLPFNQLATMSGNSNHNLDGIANYMRCCLKREPFEGAHVNIKSLFDQNKNSFTQMFQHDFVNTTSQVLSSKDPRSAAESLMKNVIITFIELTSDLYSVTTDDTRYNIREDKLNEELTLFFEMLREALDIDPVEPIVKETDYNKRTKFTPISYGHLQNTQPRYIDSTIMYEFCNIALMLQTTCHSWKKPAHIPKPEIQDFVINSVNTLTLNLLHYCTSKCQKMILSKIQTLRIQKTNGDLLSPPETEPKSYYSSCLNDLYTQTYLPTIKVFCDWLLAQSNIITSNLQSFRAFSSDLTELVSLIAELLKLSTDMETPREHDSDCDLNGSGFGLYQDAYLTIKNVDIFNHIYDGSDWKQTYPLSCDLPLVGLEAVKSVHDSNIDFKYKKDLNSAESGFVSYQCLEAFNESLKLVLIKAG